jgi:D-alanyl-D-alanine carboxypeptidase (penicillin-binding protein 5/6)
VTRGVRTFGRRAPAAALVGLAAFALALALAGPAPAARALSLDAQSAIVVESSTGDVAYSRAADRRSEIASTTKIMTALLTLERVPLDTVFTTISYNARFSDESLVGLRGGERMTVRDLLRGLLLPSGNDAAMTLALRVGGSRAAFIAAMNRRARALGLAHTHYSNPIGLDSPRNFSSARDLVTLSRVALRNRFFARTVNTPRARLLSGDRPRTVVSKNDLLFDFPFVNGVKTGHTPAAGYVLVGSATVNGVTVVSAVLGDPGQGSRDADTLALLRYGLARYRVFPVLAKGQVMARAAIKYRDGDRVGLVAASAFSQVVRRGGERPQVTVKAPSTLTGPLKAGTRVGTVVVRLRGRVVGRIPLLTAAAVPKVGILARVANSVFQPGRLVVVLVVGGLGLLMWRSRRDRRRREESRRRERRMKGEIA